MTFSVNNLVTVFKDWENQKDIIGTVMLVKKLKTGLPFILKDSTTIKIPRKESYHGTDFFNWTDEEKILGSCNVYNYEKWLCKIIKSNDKSFAPNELHNFNLRFLEGNFEDHEIFSKYNKEDEEDTEINYREKWQNKNLIDEFIAVNGEEIY